MANNTPRTAQDLIRMGFGGYQGWDDESAVQDYLGTGGAGKYTSGGGESSGTGYTSGEDYATQLINSQQANIDKEKAFITKAFKDNPFAFDEALAKKKATEEYSPYYTELLEDYLGNIGVKRENIGSEKDLYKALTTTGEGTAGKATRNYERAVSQAEEGFAGSGMYFSGIKARTTGQADVERQYGLSSQAREIGQKQRDITREQDTAIEGQVLKEKGEQWKQYLMPIEQAYRNQFTPYNQSGNLDITSYMPSEYLQYTY